MLDLRSDDVLLDLGCGTGAAVRESSATVGRAVGFDLSPAMVERARELAGTLANVEFVQGDVSGRLPFADGEFTAILCTTAFHHFPRQRDTIGEAARVLAPGGRLVIAESRHIWRDFIDASAHVTITNDTIEVRFGKRAHSPYLLDAGFANTDIPVPWWEGRRLNLAFG